MKIAITGGTGFAGRHFARALASMGHEVVVIARGLDDRDPAIRRLPGVTFFASDLLDTAQLATAFSGCDGVAHCAGINRKTARQTYRLVHVQGTQNVVNAAKLAGVRKIAMLSFLRARPDCGSPYHESKWAAEEIIRNSGIDYTILKAGMIYGRGDHMLDHLSHAVYTLPFFATVGLREKPIRPVAIEDVVDILCAAMLQGRLSCETAAVTGPGTMSLSGAARQVAKIAGRRLLVVPAPVWFHYLLARLFERTMQIPLVAKAQVRMLAEGFDEPGPRAAALPADLLPQRQFTPDQIRNGLPEPGRFTLHDFRCC